MTKTTILTAQYKGQWRAAVYTVMKLPIL